MSEQTIAKQADDNLKEESELLRILATIIKKVSK